MTAFRCPKCGRFVKGERIQVKYSNHVESGHCDKCNIDLKCEFGGCVEAHGGYTAHYHVTGHGIDKTYTYFE